MSLLRNTITGLLALMVTASFAAAQSMPGAPGAGTGAGPAAGGGGSGTPVAPTNLDLPMEKPTYVAPPGEDTDDEDDGDPTSDPGGDDPTDEPPPVIYGEEIDSENDTIFYIIDISCSMDWDTQSYTTLDGQTSRGTRMTRAKVELSRSVVGLSRNFSFNIIAFDCGTRMWAQGMQQADDANKASALAWVNSLQATGATGTGPAGALALADKENMSVVLLTDGAPNCGADGFQGHRTMISSANTQGATINVFGIAASGSYRQFCQNVASDGHGSYFDVP
jgi:hypothetical protein